MLHRRRTGTSGWLRPPNGTASVGDTLFTLGIVAVAVAPVLDLLDAPGRVKFLDHLAASVPGAVLLGGGAVVAVVAQAQMGTAWRAGIELSARSELVMHGLFGLVRNPFYTGMLTASAGVVLMAPNVAAVAGWLALLIGSEIDVRMVEEPALRSAHSGSYATYEHSTPRFLPSPRLLHHRRERGVGRRRR